MDPYNNNPENAGLNQTLDKVEKAISTTTAGGSAGLSTNVLVRENLSGIVTRLPFRETNIRDRLARKPGSGLAAAWVVMTGLTSGTSPFAEGATPTENDATYGRRSAVYKELGKKKTITDRMLAAGKSFADQEAEQTEVGIREVILDEEQLIITGDATGAPTEFDGLQNIISTNIIDDNNDPLGFRVDLIDQAVEAVMSAHGVRPTAIYIGYGMARAINQSLIGDVRVNLDSTNEVAAGVNVSFIQTTIGKLPLIPTFAIAPDSTTFAGNTVEDIYVVTEKAIGQDILYMEDLYALRKTPLARTGAAEQFMVTESTVLVCRAEEFQVRIQNVRTK